ncbi:2'-5'-oligoadenylate synthase 2-like [Patiria miniata]|uniref:2'-5'-oligoadenylate synthetase 1 domain-containing protein n=1 Tax=Patiria miniata TaxID=46514 RepID=A0A914AE06_PATMI|nr:2'-5'-oligoadenylate synthase 2-like [Patiria miniata]
MAKEKSPWQLRPSDLESFVSAHLRQSDSFVEELQRALHKVVTYVKANVSFSVSRYVVGGDLTGGTSALNEEAEFQLALFVSEFRSIDDYHKRLSVVVTQTRDLLSAEGALRSVMVREPDSVTDGMIRVRVMVGEERLEGTIVLAVDLIGSNPNKSNRETMYRQFMQDEDKSPYEPTLSDLRRGLFQNLPSPVKDVILLVKHWRKRRLRLRGDKPEVRFYELLVIHCWDVAGNPRMFNMATALKSVFNCLSEWKDISITWEGSSSLAYQRKIAEGKHREILARSRDYDGPIALDPIDPRVEYCAGVKTLIWDEISRTAREMLMEPLFKGLSSDCSKWNTK